MFYQVYLLASVIILGKQFDLGYQHWPLLNYLQELEALDPCSAQATMQNKAAWHLEPILALLQFGATFSGSAWMACNWLVDQARQSHMMCQPL